MAPGQAIVPQDAVPLSRHPTAEQVRTQVAKAALGAVRETPGRSNLTHVFERHSRERLTCICEWNGPGTLNILSVYVLSLSDVIRNGQEGLDHIERILRLIVEGRGTS